MIECVFSLDYEIYGNGTGNLDTLVSIPTGRLLEIFDSYDAKIVNYVEVAEFERIEEEQSDPGIAAVNQQVRNMYENGHEIALHLHPQWYNAKYDKTNRHWNLDYSEYNLCMLSQSRIREIVTRGINHLRRMTGDSEYVPLAFRAGNWLFMPTATAAQELARAGVKIDSSVFKGGLQRQHNLDYRPSLKNGDFWRISRDANIPDSQGPLLELPIYSMMIPTWKLFTAKRLRLGTSPAKVGANEIQSPEKTYSERQPVSIGTKILEKGRRLIDFARLTYPLKFDFCRMNRTELRDMLDDLLARDEKSPQTLRPMVAIGHSKDLKSDDDFSTIDWFLSELGRRGIPVSTFKDIYSRCVSAL